MLKCGTAYIHQNQGNGIRKTRAMEYWTWASQSSFCGYGIDNVYNTNHAMKTSTTFVFMYVCIWKKYQSDLGTLQWRPKKIDNANCNTRVLCESVDCIFFSHFITLQQYYFKLYNVAYWVYINIFLYIGEREIWSVNWKERAKTNAVQEKQQAKRLKKKRKEGNGCENKNKKNGGSFFCLVFGVSLLSQLQSIVSIPSQSQSQYSLTSPFPFHRGLIFLFSSISLSLSLSLASYLSSPSVIYLSFLTHTTFTTNSE